MTNKSNQFLSQHGRAMVHIGAVSAVGIIASVGFQLVVIRGLGPQQYGLLASFLALINVAAIGSAALRNSVAVNTADSALRSGVPKRTVKRLDSSMVEALVLGGACTAGIVFLSPFLAGSLDTNVIALLFVAFTVTPYFIFSRAQGLLQGTGDSASVVWWSTGAQVAQLVLGAFAVLLGLGAVGVLSVLLATAILGAFGSTYQARSRGIVSTGKAKPFSRDTSVVLLITIAFAWLTNVDVILVRAGSSEEIAGAYAAAAVVIKTTLIIPATLSLYLLPRFVMRKGDTAMTKLGVNVTLAITFVTGIAMVALVSIAGRVIVPVFGEGYQASVTFLPWLALAWLPWAMSQGLLIRLTASSSKSSLLVLVLAALVQWFGSAALLPDVFAMILLNGVAGLAVLVVLFIIHLMSAGTGGSSRTPTFAENAPLDQ